MGKPIEFGYDFPEVPYFFIGGCGSKNIDHYLPMKNDIFQTTLAHTHMEEQDELNNCVCFSNRTYLIDLVAYHEYAHALTKIRPKSITGLGFGLYAVKDRAEIIEVWNNAHSPEWKQIMIKLGQEPVISPSWDKVWESYNVTR